MEGKVIITITDEKLLGILKSLPRLVKGRLVERALMAYLDNLNADEFGKLFAVKGKQSGCSTSFATGKNPARPKQGKSKNRPRAENPVSLLDVMGEFASDDGA